jgi:hypothetical protein
LPSTNFRATLALALLALGLTAVGFAGPASAFPTHPRFKQYHVKTTVAVVPLATEGREVSMTIEGTLSSAKPACARNMEVSGSYNSVGSGQFRNFGPVKSEAAGHWSAGLTHVAPATERELTVRIQKRRVGPRVLCGTGPNIYEELHYKLTF